MRPTQFVNRLMATPEGRDIILMVKAATAWKEYMNSKPEGDYTPAQVAAYILEMKGPLQVDAPGEYPGKKKLVEPAKPGVLLDLSRKLAAKFGKPLAQ